MQQHFEATWDHCLDVLTVCEDSTQSHMLLTGWKFDFILSMVALQLDDIKNQLLGETPPPPPAAPAAVSGAVSGMPGTTPFQYVLEVHACRNPRWLEKRTSPPPQTFLSTTILVETQAMSASNECGLLILARSYFTYQRLPLLQRVLYRA